MVRFTVVFGLILLVFLTAAAEGMQDSILDWGDLEELSGGFTFTEGPAADSQGNIYFTDQPNDRIMKWSREDILYTWKRPSGRSNGLFFDKGGNLIACADEMNQLWEISPEGDARVLVSDFEGRLLNGPNDVWVGNDNSLYFTDPFYRRPYWKRGGMEQPGQYVYYVSPDRTEIRVVEDRLVRPNGVAATPDGSTLYVADIGDGKTYKYRIEENGDLAERRLFCSMGSDGMAVDWKGNLYLTGDGVTIFSPDGMKIGHIDVPEKWTANVCFGGEEMKTLYITASKGFYRVKLK
ncbi:MAG: SMP-30/gluconolactonase/LRE family protein [Acidobacteriota bacterium]